MNHYKGKSQRLQDLEAAIKALDLCIRKPPYHFTIDEILGFQGREGRASCWISSARRNSNRGSGKKARRPRTGPSRSCSSSRRAAGAPTSPRTRPSSSRSGSFPRRGPRSARKCSTNGSACSRISGRVRPWKTMSAFLAELVVPGRIPLPAPRGLHPRPAAAPGPRRSLLPRRASARRRSAVL